jgi:type II secretory pathway pseudopilin PulG
MKNKTHASGAFSLVELSIVLVVLGLLVGGILGGASLIRSAEMRSVITDTNAYLAAASSFRDQYRFLPGDANSAASYWSTTVNGNGDGVVTGAERFRFWEQLNLAGFVEKRFSGVQGGGGAEDFIINPNSTPNAPNSRVPFAGFGFYYANIAASTSTYAANLGNAFTFGKLGAANSGPPASAALTPADASNLDTKADDGRPGTGKWVANLTGGGNFGTATACSTDANGSTYTGNYNTALAAEACGFFMMSGY